MTYEISVNALGMVYLVLSALFVYVMSWNTKYIKFDPREDFGYFLVWLFLPAVTGWFVAPIVAIFMLWDKLVRK